MQKDLQRTILYMVLTKLLNLLICKMRKTPQERVSKATSTDRGEHAGETEGQCFAPPSLRTVPWPSAYHADGVPTALERPQLLLVQCQSV